MFHSICYAAYTAFLKIVHRDLKPENVLFDGDTALVCDWGQACEWRKGQTRSYFACGTDGYKPPELHFQTPYEGPELDVWGLGVIVFGTPPFWVAYLDTTVMIPVLIDFAQ